MSTPTCLKLANLGEKLAKLEGLKARRLLDDKLSAVSILRACEGAKVHIISQLPIRRLVVTADNLGAKSLARRLASWGVKVDVLPYRDDTLLPRKNFATQNLHERMQTLSNIAQGRAEIVVTSADSLLQFFPKRELVEKYSVTIKQEDIISPQETASRLSMAGYVRRDMIGDAGEFALRGDILDVFGIDGVAYRINFFDELVENIKIIDSETMLALSEIEQVIFPPTSDLLLDGEGAQGAKVSLNSRRENKYAVMIGDALHEGACSPNAIWALPFAKNCFESLLEYVNGGEPYLVVFDEPKVVFDKLQIVKKEFAGRIKTLSEGGEILPEHEGAMVEMAELKRLLFTARKMSFSSLNVSNPLFDAKLLIEPKTRPITKYYLDPQSIYQDIKTFVNAGAKVILACESVESAKAVKESLRDGDVYVELSDDGNGASSVLVTPLRVEVGVNYPASGVVLVGVGECVGKHRGEQLKSPKTHFIAPKSGDYVVHRVHGVGLCEGTTILKTGEFEKEYVVIRYRDGDILYVATDQMDNLQKFVGEQHPKLNKMGGKEFASQKEKVRKSVRKLAINLIDVYAKREKQKGYKYSPDTVWQKEFEDGFEYEETADQLKAIADVKHDMESGRIMDRLIVGDVGFGKTEIAFRAMFKTVLDSKQAVLLAPTTILARQHFENLSPRLEKFGVRCALLTRLQSSAENKKVLEDLKSGVLHIVVATHKVLAKAVEFCDLGLLVLDEEQRFGVEHKEKLKEKHPLVNVLTLSATPIPRTLNMSLSGIRDISMLETAPVGRLPVQTYVVEYSDALCVDAINREVARGGQTFILCNDIDQLDYYANKFRSLCDGARIITAHGQLPPTLLEERISSFYDKQFDVLISTTIIENGIDLPDANTLIVIDSGRFGLSQLYQLRGRVGRRGALAHAYFTLPTTSTLTPTAEKRLNTLLENTEIGSGFRVALADLSIRGAGNVLGAEQSGHIEKVGYEMYLELLDEAIEEIRTGVVREKRRDCEMKVDAVAYISDGYVGARDKLRVYKQISNVSSVQARDALIKELEEVYGEVDLPLENLINIALLKNLASTYDAAKVMINRNGAGVSFHDATVFANEQLMRQVSANSDSVVLTSTIPPSLIFEANKLTAEQKLAKLIKFFATI